MINVKKIACVALFLSCFVQLSASIFFNLAPIQKIQELTTKKHASSELNEYALGKYLNALETFSEASSAFSVLMISLSLVQFFLSLLLLNFYRAKKKKILGEDSESVVSEFIKGL